MKVRKANQSNSPKTIFLQNCVDILSPFLSNFFNRCIVEGKYPNKLKLAEIVPIYKSGSKLLPKNWRPIALLSPFTKNFENYLFNELINFFNKNKSLYHLQYGFREGSSTELAITQIVDEISLAMENKHIMCNVFLDLEKAFNTVNHSILLQKLERLGIRSNTLKLIHSYLDNRFQFTLANGSRSTTERIKCGVPQGSTLGPLLFLVYINDLPQATYMKVRMFADDACLSLEADNPNVLTQKTNQELNKIVSWMNINKLFLNFSKSNFMIFTGKRLNHQFNIKLGDVNLKRVYQTKYLGVIIDSNLTWKPHLTNLRNKLIRHCHLLNKTKNLVPKKTLIQIYYSTIYPHLQYAITAWGNANKTLIEKMFVMQKTIIKIILKKPRKTDSNPLFRELNFLKLYDIYKLQLGKMMYKINQNSIGENNLISIKQIHQYSTRQAAKNNYFTIGAQTKIGGRRFSIEGPKLWNNIPISIRQNHFLSFKTQYKKYLLHFYNNYYNSI